MLRRLFALLVLAALVAAAYYYWRGRAFGGSPASLRAVEGDLRDAATTGAVKAALGLRRSLKPYRLSVSTEDGVVTLRGLVAKPDEQALAERTAAAVPDVRQVVNQIQLGASPERSDEGERSLGESLDDQALEVQVKLAFSLDRNLRGTKLEARSFKRQVQLSGEVKTPAQRDLALAIARETPGVTDVTESVHVIGEAGRSDARTAVEKALRANPNLARCRIEVREEGGRIVLRGRVRTGAEKDLAGLLASNAAGSNVDNNLEIKP